MSQLVNSGTPKLEAQGFLLSLCTEAEVDSITELSPPEKNALKMVVRGRVQDDLELAYVVPPFPVNFDFGDATFLNTIIPATSLSYKGYQSPEMDFSHYDAYLTHVIALWMDGTIGKGKNGIISRDDALFAVFAHLANLPMYSRNLHGHFIIDSVRFDRTDKYGGIPLVVSVEKPETLEDAVADLRRKARWLPHFALLPFIFCTAATADELEVFKLMPDLTLVSLFKARLRNVVDRWKCVLVAINMARALKLFIQQGWVIASTLSFDEWHERNNKHIRLQMQCVEVQFKTQELYQRMTTFYMATSAVPNLERLFLSAEVPAYSPSKKIIRLGPVGVTRKPRDSPELLTAIRQLFGCMCTVTFAGVT